MTIAAMPTIEERLCIGNTPIPRTTFDHVLPGESPNLARRYMKLSGGLRRDMFWLLKECGYEQSTQLPDDHVIERIRTAVKGLRGKHTRFNAKMDKNGKVFSDCVV